MRAPEDYLGIQEDPECKQIEMLLPITVDVESFSATIKSKLISKDKLDIEFNYSKIKLPWLGRKQRLVQISLNGGDDVRKEFVGIFWNIFEDYLDANGF